MQKFKALSSAREAFYYLSLRLTSFCCFLCTFYPKQNRILVPWLLGLSIFKKCTCILLPEVYVPFLFHQTWLISAHSSLKIQQMSLPLGRLHCPASKSFCSDSEPPLSLYMTLYTAGVHWLCCVGICMPSLSHQPLGSKALVLSVFLCLLVSCLAVIHRRHLWMSSV